MGPAWPRFYFRPPTQGSAEWVFPTFRLRALASVGCITATKPRRRRRRRHGMKLADLITPELVEVPLQAADKWEALRVLARVPVRAGRYPAAFATAVEQALVLRGVLRDTFTLAPLGRNDVLQSDVSLEKPRS